MESVHYCLLGNLVCGIAKWLVPIFTKRQCLGVRIRIPSL